MYFTYKSNEVCRKAPKLILTFQGLLLATTTIFIQPVFALNPQPLPPGLMHGYIALNCSSVNEETPQDPCGRVIRSLFDGSSKDPTRIHYQELILTQGTVCKNLETNTLAMDLFYKNSQNPEEIYELKGTYKPEYKDGDDGTSRPGTFIGYLNPQPLPPGFK